MGGLNVVGKSLNRSWSQVLRLNYISLLQIFNQIIKPDVFEELRDMVERELLVWSAVGSHPYILKLRDVLCSGTRMYYISGMKGGWSAVVPRCGC